MLRVEGDNYFIERFFDGKEARLHIDQSAKMNSRIGQGDRIVVKVGEANDQLHVLSLRQLA